MCPLYPFGQAQTDWFLKFANTAMLAENKSICKLNVITKSSSKVGILEWVGGQQGQWTEKHGLAGRLPRSLCCRKFIQHRQIQRLPQSVSVPASLQIRMNWCQKQELTKSFGTGNTFTPVPTKPTPIHHQLRKKTSARRLLSETILGKRDLWRE